MQNRGLTKMRSADLSNALLAQASVAATYHIDIVGVLESGTLHNLLAPTLGASATTSLQSLLARIWRLLRVSYQRSCCWGPRHLQQLNAKMSYLARRRISQNNASAWTMSPAFA